jgi:uncharacterized Zn-finger protein
MRTHTNERPFKCPVLGCTDAFKQYSNQMKHLKTHKEYVNLPCRVCSKEFPRNKLIDHYKRNHSDDL